MSLVPGATRLALGAQPSKVGNYFGAGELEPISHVVDAGLKCARAESLGKLCVGEAVQGLAEGERA